MKIQERQSNIELLRIITMCGVIILHYNNATIGGGFAYATGLNLYILYFLESLCICAVDLFVLITGYFMCEKQDRILNKPLELLLQVILFNVAFYVVSVILHSETLSVKHILERMIPANWFVILYVTLYFISPFLNLAINEAERTGNLKRFMIVFMLLFSVYPTIIDFLTEITQKEYIGLSSIGMYGSQWGYSIVNFSLMYTVGAYLRKNKTTGGIKKHLILFLAMAFVLMIWRTVNDATGFLTESSAWEYCNPIVIFMAIEGFIIFQRLEIGCKQWINKLAGASFTVYLLHHRLFCFFKIPQFVTEKPWIMVLHIVLSTVIIYFVSTVVWMIYNKIIICSLTGLYKKYPILKKNIYSIDEVHDI